MADAKKGTFAVKVGLAQMLKGGVIMDVVNVVRVKYPTFLLFSSDIYAKCRRGCGACRRSCEGD